MTNLLLSLLCALALTACASEAGPPVFTVSTDNPTDTVTVKIIGTTAIFDIVSPTGIGKAQVKRAGGGIPTRIDFVIHTKGLENFTLTNETSQYQANVPTAGGPPRVFTGPRDGELSEHAVVFDEPTYMEVKVFGKTQKPPLGDDGYIQLTASKRFLEQGARDFTISWVDFYR